MEYYLRALLPIGVIVAFLVWRTYSTTPTQSKIVAQGDEGLSLNRDSKEIALGSHAETVAVQQDIARQLDRIATAL